MDWPLQSSAVIHWSRPQRGEKKNPGSHNQGTVGFLFAWTEPSCDHSRCFKLFWRGCRTLWTVAFLCLRETCNTGVLDRLLWGRDSGTFWGFVLEFSLRNGCGHDRRQDRQHSSCCWWDFAAQVCCFGSAWHRSPHRAVSCPVKRQFEHHASQEFGGEAALSRSPGPLAVSFICQHHLYLHCVSLHTYVTYWVWTRCSGSTHL